MAIAVASGVAARWGVLVKNGAVLEQLSNTTHVLFDKTGTLTKGEMSVVAHQRWTDQVDASRLWVVVAALESRSSHALAKALHTFAAPLTHHSINMEGFLSLSGRGVQAQIEGQLWQAGSVGWMQAQGITLSSATSDWLAEQANMGATSVCVSCDGVLVATIALADSLREDAIEVVAALQARGIQVSMITGDRAAVATVFAQQLGGISVTAEVLPEDKEAVVRSLQGEGRVVVFVGDGINDAPALVRADVGIALGSGTEVSVDSAEVVLLNNQLTSVLNTIKLSTITLRTIRQNIAMSLLYNLIMVPLAVSAKLTPLMAAIGMPLSSLLVIGNAARIKAKANKK